MNHVSYVTPEKAWELGDRILALGPVKAPLSDRVDDLVLRLRELFPVPEELVGKVRLDDEGEEEVARP